MEPRQSSKPAGSKPRVRVNFARVNAQAGWALDAAGPKAQSAQVNVAGDRLRQMAEAGLIEEASWGGRLGGGGTRSQEVLG